MTPAFYDHSDHNRPPEDYRHLGELIDQKSMEAYNHLEDFLSNTIIRDTTM